MFRVINPINVCGPVKVVDGQSGIFKYPIIYSSIPETTPVQKFTLVEEMTVYETSIWIWTLGYNNRWPEAEWYSINFRKNAVAGYMLPSLSRDILKYCLGVQNPNHRMAIRSAIEFLFPNTKKDEQFKAATESGLGDARHGSVYSGFKLESHSSLTCSTSGFVEDMSVSDCTSPRNHDMSVSDCTSPRNNDMSVSDCTSPRNNYMNDTLVRENIVSENRCLILSLNPYRQISLRETEQLKSRFAEFNYTVKILPNSSKPNSYIIIFDNEQNALKACARSKAIGYNLAKYSDRHPSPVNLVRFKALITLKVRAGISFNDRKIGLLKKNQIVTVNQVVGSRARISFFQNKERLTGWVSLHNGAGTMYLRQLE